MRKPRRYETLTRVNNKLFPEGPRFIVEVCRDRCWRPVNESTFSTFKEAQVMEAENRKTHLTGVVR